MLFRKYSHGHSLGIGVLVGLAAMSYRMWLVVAAAFVAGIVVALVVPPFVRASRHFASVAGDVAAGMRAKRRPITKLVDPDDLGDGAAFGELPRGF